MTSARSNPVAISNGHKSPSFFDLFVKGEVQHGFWNLVTKVLVIFNSLLLVKFLTLYEYGVYHLVLAFVALLNGIFMKFLGGVVMNDIIRLESDGQSSVAKKLFYEFGLLKVVVGLILSVATWFAADLIAHYYNQHTSLFFRIVAPIFLVDALYNTIKMFFNFQAAFNYVAMRPAIYNSIRLLLLLVVFLTIGFSIHAVLGVYVIASALSLIVFIPIFITRLKRWDTQAIKGSVLFGVIKAHGKWDIFRSILTTMPHNIRPWLIKIFVSTEAVAIFDVANMMYGAVKDVLPGNTLAALVPREITNRERSQKIFTYGIKYLSLLSIGLGLAAFLVAWLAIHFILPAYGPSLPLLAALLPSLIPHSFTVMMGTMLISLRKQKFLFYRLVIQAGIILTLYVLLLPVFGVFGLALEVFITHVLIAVLTTIYLYRFKPGLIIKWRSLITFSHFDRFFIKLVLSRIYDMFARKLFFLSRRKA